jgi:hypothetical protein
MCVLHKWPNGGKRLHRARNSRILYTMRTREMPLPSERNGCFVCPIATINKPSCSTSRARVLDNSHGSARHNLKVFLSEILGVQDSAPLT